jgi:hypothetical protein
LITWVANADGVGLATDTLIADIDIEIARSEIITGVNSQGDVVTAGRVVIERLIADGRVGAASIVVIERSITNARVVGAGCVELQHQETDGCVVVASGEPEEGEIAQTRVVVGIAETRTLRIRHRRKRKAGQGEPSECNVDNVWDWFHVFISFGCCSPRFAGRSSRKKLGEN